MVFFFLRFYEKIKEYGNPFLMEHEQIIKIDNHDAYDPTITVSIKSLEKKWSRTV